MKTSTIALALSLLGTTMAAPSAESSKRQDTRYPYSLNGLWLRRLTEADRYAFLTYVGRYDSSGEILSSTTCQTSWNPEAPAGPENPVACADPAFSFFFPNGIQNLENYEITVNGPDGQARGEIVAGPKYACGPYEGMIEGIEYECRITDGGAFFLPLV
ncbi:hypothetical protein BJX61DRAFT_518666 [Aspergillus egyptiacus]|nr:hypothetical protein BJX61DRAFT_518666 [Aspergillus egyptiacus]